MFWQVVGDIIPLAVGVIISPFPIAAVIALLLGPKAKSNPLAFALTFLIATFVLTLVFASGAKGSTSGSESESSSILNAIVGFGIAAFFFYFAWRTWHHRPRPGERPPVPKWLDAIDSFGIAQAVGIGALLATVNVKNLPILMTTGATIGSADLDWELVFLAVAIFSIVASLGVIVPALIGASGSARVHEFLARAKDGLITHNSTIMTVLFVILGASQLGKAIGTF